MKIGILNVKIDKITLQEALAKTEEFLVPGKQGYIVTVNPEMVLEAQNDEKFKETINKADLAVADGAGLLWAATFLKKRIRINPSLENREEVKFKTVKYIYDFFLGSFLGLTLIFYPRFCRWILPERITGVDLMLYVINKYSRDKDIKFFLLGAQKGVADLAGKKLAKKFPGIKITGIFSGDSGEKGDRVALALINQKKPDILFVAYGAPKQEKWIARNLEKMPSVKLAMGVGGAFDMISGRIKRAPKWMRSAGLEWIWRLAKEPKRIKRIYNATVKFSLLVIKLS